MLKVARAEEEQRGAAAMSWYAGQGAALVVERDGPAILLERIVGTQSLVEMAHDGRDDEARRILCATVETLHAARRDSPPSALVPLSRWFRALNDLGPDSPFVLLRARETARQLLSESVDPVVLHGDIHHANVLHDARRGWLAIDPKGLLGDRAFDYANIFCNPDVNVATAPGRLARHASIVAEEAKLEPVRVLRWAAAYAGLSAAWLIEEGSDPALPLIVAEMAWRELTL